MNIFDIDQATFDRWSELGQFVLFGEGEHVQRRPSIPGVGTPYNYASPGTFPPADFVEAAQACETCSTGSNAQYSPGRVFALGFGPDGIRCPDGIRGRCSNGRRRHPVTVPCDHCTGSPRPGMIPESAGGWYRCSNGCTNGRITVAHATAEWGPARVVEKPSDSPNEPCVTILPRGVIGYWPRDGRPIEVPPVDLYVGAWTPDVDPASLVGQYTIGGTIVKV